MDAGLRPVVDSVNAIRVPQDYMTSASRVRRTARWACSASNCRMPKCRADAAQRWR